MLDVRGRMPAMVFVYRFTPELRHNACQSRRAKLTFAPSSLPFPVPVTSFQCPGSRLSRVLVTGDWSLMAERGLVAQVVRAHA